MQKGLPYGLSVFIIAIISFSLISCGKATEVTSSEYESYTESQDNWDYIEPEVMTEITVLAGDKQLDGVLFDNETARLFAGKLPITAGLWDPAPGFAKAFNMDEPIPDVDKHTRRYELGGLAYWYNGSAVAVFYSDHLEQTIVPVVTIGKIIDDVSFFAGYEGSITIKVKNTDVVFRNRQ